MSSLKTGSKSAIKCQLKMSMRGHCVELPNRMSRREHFTYLFDNTTTWGSGRNKLFFHAVERRLDYIYYIFLEDDIAIKFNEATTPAMKRLSPILVFQDWLLDYEPAVGAVNYEQDREAKTVLQRRRTLCNTHRLVNDASLANPTISFNPLLNAFHAKAVTHIFPLDTRHEKVNWWLTDKYVTSVVELKFRGQALLFFPVTVEDLLHRPYPRSLYGTKAAWQGFIKGIQKQTPSQYANNVLFEKFKRDPELYVATSRTYCMNGIRHQDIAPFAHFERESVM
ncbi:hypothetical protein OS493_025539 [Desmophyllum pertusum]|uniref:Uncharacterized protein n=1 Tax=Desmophyllum pertusum TaxID=174260 RepID=A0A9W9YAD0_9CNID|nr:hypothetical protein OS493_025539 [Desmophyllum pertusum]